MSFLHFVYVYIIGGLTFLPLVVLGWYLSLPVVQPKEEEEEPLKAGEIEESTKSGISAYKSGWLTVTQEYIESLDDISSSTQSINESHDNKSAYSTLYKLVKNSEGNEPIDPEIVAAKEEEKVRTNQKKHRFYGVLKHGNLFLYKNQTLKDVKHVIVLSNQLVTLWPRNLTDAQLFTNRTAICLMKKDWTRSRRQSENFGTEKLTVNDILDSSNNLSPPKSSFFIYCDTNITKEDWYFALIRASKIEDDKSPLSSDLYAKTLHFETNEMMDLIQTLYSSEGQLQTKWLNALLGRLFLSLKRTNVLHDFLKVRIVKKLNKIKAPGFLDKFKLGELDVGNSVPFFTFPDLKEINPNGTLIFTSYVHYHGNMSSNISTKVNLNFGSLSQTQVDVVLKVTLQKLEGPIIFKIKPPPSDRLWYSFEIEPIMNLKIEPIISARQMSYNIITNSIEKRFKEAIKESLVLPHWDDIVFYDTEPELFRGGIWDKSVRPQSNVETDESEVSKSETSTKSDISESNINISSTNPKMKLTNTLTDLSKRMKKSKSSHTVGINGDNWLSDGSMSEKTLSTDSSNISTAKASIGKTWKKIGDWYTSNNEKPMDYHRPEMISNRRRPRKASEVDIPSSPQSSNHSITTSVSSPSYEMFKSSDVGINHSRKNSRLGSESLGSPIDIGEELPEDTDLHNMVETKDSSSFTSVPESALSERFGSERNGNGSTTKEMDPNLEDKIELSYSLSPRLKSDPTLATNVSEVHTEVQEEVITDVQAEVPTEVHDQIHREVNGTEDPTEFHDIELNPDHIDIHRTESKLHRKAPPPL